MRLRRYSRRLRRAYRKYSNYWRKTSRTSRKRKLGRASRVRVRGSLVIPDETFVKLKYYDVRSFTGTSLSDQVYRGNSIYDPDFTNAGGTAIGLSPYQNLYTKYVVYGCKIRLKSVQEGNTTTVCELMPSLTSTAAAGDFQAQPYGRMAVLGQAGGGHDITTLKGYMATNKLYGVPKATIGIEQSYAATTTSNPTFTWFWLCRWRDPTTSGGVSVQLYTVLTYYVRFYNRINSF